MSGPRAGSIPTSKATWSANRPTGSYWSMISGNCSQARRWCSSEESAPSIARHHWPVLRSMMPVEAAEETLITSKFPVR